MPLETIKKTIKSIIYEMHSGRFRAASQYELGNINDTTDKFIKKIDSLFEEYETEVKNK